jgi:GT2 family glycosyltransferase
MRDPRQPAAKAEKPQDRLDRLERDLAALTSSLARRDGDIASLKGDVSELMRQVAMLSQPAISPAKPPYVLPRPLRVFRKRLRALGLWPAEGPAGGGKAGNPLVSARQIASPTLRSFLEPLDPYAAWIAANAFTEAAREDLERALAEADGKPRISVITPVYNTDPLLLEDMVRSVTGQVYGDWELCIVDDASPSAETRTALARLADTDPRIKLITMPANTGISGATNAAVAMATGDVIAFLDHDDLLTPDCLGEIALYYARHPEADLVYSDDDKISEAGVRYAPQFKPDWSPTLLLSFMYMSHVLTVRRELYEDLGGFRSEFDGSQDYDFALRAGEKARHVGHIPRILYHWRASAGSTAHSGDAKPEAFQAGLNAVKAAMERRGIDAEVIHPDWALATKVGMYGLRFPDDGPRVTVIIPTYNKSRLLADCLQSLTATSYRNYDVMVVDNGSDEPESLAYLKTVAAMPRHSVVRIERQASGFSFAGLMNEAARHARGEFLLFLNNDTKVIAPGWISQMVGYARMDGVGAVGARLYFGDGTIQHAGIVNGYNEGLVGHAFRAAAPHDWGYMGFIKTAREYSAVTAACMLTSRKVFQEVGGFDETNFAVAYNDVDYGYRLVQKGLTNVYCADAELFHLEGKSRGRRDNLREIIALRQMYGDWQDAWYNPNLSLESERFEVGTRRLPRRAAGPVKVVAVSHNLRHEGAPNTLFDLLAGLKRDGFIEAVVLSPGDGPLRQDYEAAGIEVRIFEQPVPGADIAGYDRLCGQIAEIYKAADAQVIIANTLTMYFAIDAAHRAGLAAIWCQHESEPWETYFDNLKPEVRAHAYAAFGQAYRVTYVADATRRRWEPVQTRSNAQTIRHGVPPERLAEEVGRWSRDEARVHLDIDDSDLVVILMGTVCRRKGQMDLLVALSGMSPYDAGRLKVFIVGATGEADYAEMISTAIGGLSPSWAGRVHLTGAVPDMTPYYAAADIFVGTSRIESAPRVIVEAMAFSLPVITTPVFGIPEIVRKDINAVFYEAGDAAALRDTILKLVSEPQERHRLASNSADVLASLPGYCEMVAAYAELIQEAALQKNSASPSTERTI